MRPFNFRLQRLKSSRFGLRLESVVLLQTFMIGWFICWNHSYSVASAPDEQQGQCCGSAREAASDNKSETIEARRLRIRRLQQKMKEHHGKDVQRQYNIAVLAKFLDHDVERMFAFVRDQIYFHPYQGALRGGRGALLAGAANDIDRCLLMAELLQHGPQEREIRLVFGRLSKDQGRKLIRRALSGAPARLGYAGGSAANPLRTVDKRHRGLSQQEMESRSKSLAERLVEGYEIDIKTLDEALGAAKVKVDGDQQDKPDSYLNGVRDHMWIQIRQKGDWIDLDPSFREAQIGWRPTAINRRTRQVPVESKWRFQLSVAVERLRDGELETKTIYSKTRDTAALADKAISLTVMPEQLRFKSFAEIDSQSPLQRLAQQSDRFQMVVKWGDKQEQSRLFDWQGNVYKSRDGSFVQMGSVVGRRVTSLFQQRGSLFGSDDAPKPRLTAVQLEMSLQSPGGKERTEVRRFLDRLQPGARETSPPKLREDLSDQRGRLALTQSWTLWVHTGTRNDAYALSRLYRSFGPRGAADLLLDLHEEARSKPWQDVAKQVSPLPLSMLGFAQNSLIMAQRVFPRGDGLCFIERPSLFLWKEAAALQDAKVAYRRGVDIVSAPLGCISDDTSLAAHARLVYGLMLSEEETMMVDAAKEEVVSAAAITQRASEEGVSFLALTPERRDQIDGLPFDAEAKWRIGNALDRGYVLVLPIEPVEIQQKEQVAWWQIDPRTGACLGIGQTGEGQAVSEGLLVLDVHSIPMVQNVMKYVICFNAGVAAGQTIQQTGGDCGKEFMKRYLENLLGSMVSQFKGHLARNPNLVKPDTSDSSYIARMSPFDGLTREAWDQASKRAGKRSIVGSLADLARQHGYGAYVKQTLANRVKMQLEFGAEIAAAASGE